MRIDSSPRILADGQARPSRLVHVAALRRGHQFLINGRAIAVSTGRGTTLTPINPRE